MDIKEVRSLVALAELGTLTRAADRLNLSPSAIFKQLKQLESELRVTLYDKSGRQLRLTAAAETLLPHLRGLLAQHDAALAALDEWKGVRRGALRIGVGPTFGYYMLPPLLTRYRRRYPDIDTFIEAGHSQPMLTALRQGTIDVAFLMASEMLEAQDLTMDATWDFEVALVSGLADAPRRCALKELASYPFILYKPGAIFERLIDGYFAAHGFQPRVVMRFDNAEGIKTMLRLGMGLTMLPRWTVEAELKDRTLTYVELREPPLRAKLAMITRTASFHAQPLRAFLDMARQWTWGTRKP